MESPKRYKDVASWLESPSMHLNRGPIAIDQWFADRYQIDFLLGFGHTSYVFRATDTILQRTVALKIWNNIGYGIEASVLLSLRKRGRESF